MAGPSASTPFLADNDHDNGDDYDEGETLVKNAPANAYFIRPIRILTSITSLFSILIFGLLIASVVLLKIGPFNYTYSSVDTARDLAICLFVNFLLTTPTIFFQIPIIIAMAVNIAMGVVVLVFSSYIFAHGWPNSNFCYRYERGPPPEYRFRPLPATRECRESKRTIQIILAVAAGSGILIGILILATLLLRAIALAKTRFWEDKAKVFGKMGWKSTGFTVQFTLSILPHDATSEAAPLVAQTPSGEEGRLIET